jgi:hypothetical protein
VVITVPPPAVRHRDRLQQTSPAGPAVRIGSPMLTTILIIAAVIICLNFWLRRS